MDIFSKILDWMNSGTISIILSLLGLGGLGLIFKKIKDGISAKKEKEMHEISAKIAGEKSRQLSEEASSNNEYFDKNLHNSIDRIIKENEEKKSP